MPDKTCSECRYFRFVEGEDRNINETCRYHAPSPGSSYSQADILEVMWPYVQSTWSCREWKKRKRDHKAGEICANCRYRVNEVCVLNEPPRPGLYDREELKRRGLDPNKAKLYPEYPGVSTADGWWCRHWQEAD